MSNYPDGVSDKDIDKHFGSPEELMYDVEYLTASGLRCKELMFVSDTNQLAKKIEKLEEQGCKIEDVKQRKKLWGTK